MGNGMALLTLEELRQIECCNKIECMSQLKTGPGFEYYNIYVCPVCGTTLKDGSKHNKDCWLNKRIEEAEG